MEHTVIAAEFAIRVSDVPFVPQPEQVQRWLPIADQIFAYANKHYEDGGWDVIIECYTPTSLIETLMSSHGRPIANVKEFWDDVRFMVDVMADRQADARNSEF